MIAPPTTPTSTQRRSQPDRAGAQVPSPEIVGCSMPHAQPQRRMVDRVLIALGRRDVLAEADALALALRGCAEDQAGALVDQLLALAGTPAESAGLGYAARAFDRIDPAKQQRLLALGHGQALDAAAAKGSSGGIGGWSEAAAIGLSDAYPDEQTAIARLIGESLDPCALPHLCTLLGSDHEMVAAAAGRALIKAAHRANRAPQLDEYARQGIEACIVRGVQDFPSHRRREVLYALVMLLSTPASWAASGAELRTLLQDHEHPAVLALRAIIKKDADPVSRRAALQWLTYEPLRAAAIDRLFQHAHVDGQQAALGGAHLLANPLRAVSLDRAATRERAKSTLTPEPDHLEHLSLEAARGALMVALRWATDALPSLAEAALGDHRAAVRLRAASALGTMMRARDQAFGEAQSILTDLTFDSHPGVARSALLNLWCTDGTSPDCLSILARSEHPDVRALTALSHPEDAPISIRTRLAADRVAFTRDLQRRIIVGTQHDRIQAIQLARRLHLSASIELELLTILQRSADLHAAAATDEPARTEQRIAATAVAALAESPTPAARIAVERALHHPDDRVRANALDALTRAARRTSQLVRGTPIHATLVEFKTDARHRVRAGAIRADLLATLRDPAVADSGAAILQAVTPLISDARPMHRLSGLWLVERFAAELGSGWKDTSATQALCGAVDELAQSEADPRTRHRASQTASRLHARLRLGWGASVAR